MTKRYLNKSFITMMLFLSISTGCQWFQNTFTTVKTKFQNIHEAGNIDDKDEDQLGRSVGILVTNKYPPTDNKGLIEYVNLVGYSLVSTSDKPANVYHFGVLDSSDIEAYSGPGGYVMVTTGAIHAMHDEAELAGVLAHELTHVIEQHGLEEAKRAARKAGYMDLMKTVIPAEDATKFIDQGVDAVVRNGYDKPHEDAADKGAVHLLLAAGYDPHSYAHFLSHLAALQQMQPTPTTQQTGSQVLMAKVMDSHPDLAGRYLEVNKEIADAGTAGGATMRDRFVAYTVVH